MTRLSNEKGRTITVTNYVVRYQEHVSSKPYDELVAAFEEGIGDGSGLSASALREAFINDNTRQAWESLINDNLGPAGFPLQILIHEGEDGSARIGYDLPSSVLGLFGNAEVDAVAKELDRKVVGFITKIAGVSA